MSAFNRDDFIGNEYRMRKRILVSIFSQSFPLEHGRDDYLEKAMLEDKQGYRSDVDAGYLQQIFKQMYYPEIAEVKMTDCKTKSEIKCYIQNLGVSQEYLQYDFFFFVFLTFMSCSNNGSTVYKDERIHLYDGLCSMQEIYDEVKAVRTLAMKPKIFLVQCDDISLLKEYKEYTKGDYDRIIPMKIPQDADRLVIMSDIPQRLANPDLDAEIKHPSFLIQAFGETLLENSRRSPEKRLDLFALTSIINGKVQKMINDLRVKGNKRTEDMDVPLVSSTLTKLVKI